MFQYSGSRSYNASAKTFISSWREKVWFAQQFIRRSVEMMLSHEYGGIDLQVYGPKYPIYVLKSSPRTEWTVQEARSIPV